MPYWIIFTILQNKYVLLLCLNELVQFNNIRMIYHFLNISLLFYIFLKELEKLWLLFSNKLYGIKLILISGLKDLTKCAFAYFFQYLIFLVYYFTNLIHIKKNICIINKIQYHKSLFHGGASSVFDQFIIE